MKAEKPLGRKNYGHIPHLPESRQGPGDHRCHEGQARIATEKARDQHDEIIVQEKLDGSNVGVVRINGVLFPLGRAGYPAISSSYEQHRLFHDWVYRATNYARFLAVLQDGERLVGEWLAQAHGTRYDLQNREPFVAFDLMIEDKRLPYDDFWERIGVRGDSLTMPPLLHRGVPLSIADAMTQLEPTAAFLDYGQYGALDPVEGCVWRVERDKLTDRHSGKRKRVVDFLVKYVRPDKIDGAYLPNLTGNGPIWNWQPSGED